MTSSTGRASNGAVDKVSIQVFVNDGEMYYVAPLNSVDAERILEAYVGTGTGEPGRLGDSSKAVLRRDLQKSGSRCVGERYAGSALEE